MATKHLHRKMFTGEKKDYRNKRPFRDCRPPPKTTVLYDMQGCNCLGTFPTKSSYFYIGYGLPLLNFTVIYNILIHMALCRSTAPRNVIKKRNYICNPDSLQSFLGSYFFLGPCYTLPSSFVRIDNCSFLSSSAYKRTNKLHLKQNHLSKVNYKLRCMKCKWTAFI